MNRITKGFMSVLMVFLLCFNSVGSFAEAAADVEKPVIQTISVNKKSAKLGEKVVYTIKATDNVGIRRVSLSLRSPQTEKDEYLTANYVSPGTYQVEKTVTDATETGTWRVVTVSAYDTSDNNLSISNNQVLSWVGTKDYSFLNVNIGSDDKVTEIVTTEQPTTEQPTTERPTTERPTTERPTTEKPTTEKPTTERPTTEKPTTKPLVTNTTPTINTISNNSTTVSGKAKSYSTVYVVANKKVIAQGKAKYSKYSLKIAKQKAGTKISVYTVYKNVKSKTATTKVIDKIAPVVPSINKVTTKSVAITGKGEASSKVLVYKKGKLWLSSSVTSKGIINVKITKQKKGTQLKVYLKDKSGNISKARAVKVS